MVVGYEAESVKRAIGADVQYALQSDQLGTGHAAMQAVPLVTRPTILVLPGDAPLITSEALGKLARFHTENRAAATLLTAILDNPGSYGRVVRAEDGTR